MLFLSLLHEEVEMVELCLIVELLECVELPVEGLPVGKDLDFIVPSQ